MYHNLFINSFEGHGYKIPLKITYRAIIYNIEIDNQIVQTISM